MWHTHARCSRPKSLRHVSPALCRSTHPEAALCRPLLFHSLPMDTPLKCLRHVSPALCRSMPLPSACPRISKKPPTPFCAACPWMIRLGGKAAVACPWMSKTPSLYHCRHLSPALCRSKPPLSPPVDVKRASFGSVFDMFRPLYAALCCCIACPWILKGPTV